MTAPGLLRHSKTHRKATLLAAASRRLRFKISRVMDWRGDRTAGTIYGGQPLVERTRRELAVHGLSLSNMEFDPMALRIVAYVEGPSNTAWGSGALKDWKVDSSQIVPQQ